VFSQILFVNLLLCGAAVVLISMILFYWFASQSLKDSHKANQLILNNIQNVVSKYIESAERISQELFYSPFIKRVLYSNSDEWNSDMFVVANNTMNSMSSNTWIDSIYICTQNKVLSKTSNSVPLANMDTKILNLINLGTYSDPVLLRLDTANSRNKIYLTCVTGEINQKSSRYLNAVVVNINIDVMYQNIYGSMPDGVDVLVANHNGMIMLSRDKSRMGTLLSSDILQKISPYRSDGNFVMTVDGKDIFTIISLPIQIFTSIKCHTGQE
jgi:hypothetical protein